MCDETAGAGFRGRYCSMLFFQDIRDFIKKICIYQRRHLNSEEFIVGL
jgi:hypothetical protein